MLEELRIRDLGVIEDAVLTLGPGLTVVTGETGAGKTMVVTGLSLLFGERADGTRVRVGAERASVDGRVSIAAGSSAAQRVLDAGGDLDDGAAPRDRSVVLRRVVSAAGRSRAFVGGAPAPVGVLGELAERLLAVHGQAEQQTLTRPAEQRAVLDRFAGLDVAPYATAFERWQLLTGQLAERRARARELQREADLLRHGIAEIRAAQPQPGEDTGLATATARLAHADALRLAAQAAHDALLGDPDDPGGDGTDVSLLLGRARRALSQQAGADPALDALAVRLADLAAVAADLGADLAGYREQLDADPRRLAELEQRRAVLATLIRKYAEDDPASVDGVLAWVADAEQRLAELDVSDDALAALAAQRDAAAGDAAKLATELATLRTDAAARLAAAVTAELAGLAMSSARVAVEVRRRPATAGAPVLVVGGAEVGAGPDGVDEVALLLQPHQDAPALPLQRGASGGELSRVMLALEVSLGALDPVPTMVFDEVDAGVGGRAAVEIGRRLARLARDHQVIVVTHLAQVAAYADRHVVVDKAGAAGVTRSDVRVVEGADRVVELARMLAGSGSSTAREHAAELLADAESDRIKPARRKKRTVSKPS